MGYLDTLNVTQRAIDRVENLVISKDIGTGRPDGTDIDVFNTTSPCILLAVRVSTVAIRHQFRIFLRDESGVLMSEEITLHYPWSNSLSRSINALNIHNSGGETALWKEVLYESGRYVFVLKKPLICPTGVKFNMRSGGDTGIITADVIVGYYKDDELI